jgi:hypothetical protein
MSQTGLLASLRRLFAGNPSCAGDGLTTACSPRAVRMKIVVVPEIQPLAQLFHTIGGQRDGCTIRAILEVKKEIPVAVRLATGIVSDS